MYFTACAAKYSGEFISVASQNSLLSTYFIIIVYAALWSFQIQINTDNSRSYIHGNNIEQYSQPLKTTYLHFLTGFIVDLSR